MAATTDDIYPTGLAPPKSSDNAAAWATWYAKVHPLAVKHLPKSLADTLPDAKKPTKTSLMEAIDDEGSALRVGLKFEKTAEASAAAAAAGASAPQSQSQPIIVKLDTDGVVRAIAEAAATAGAAAAAPAGAGASSAQTTGSAAARPTAASLGLDDGAFAWHPTNFDDARVDALLNAICGPSIAELEQTETAKRAIAEAKAGTGSGRAAADASPAEPTPKHALLSNDIGLAQAFAACSIAANTPQSFLANVGAQIALASELATDEHRDTLTVSASSRHRDTPGTIPAYRVASDQLTAVFEARGRSKLSQVVVNYIKKMNDPLKLAVTRPSGQTVGVCWLTYLMRVYLQSHLCWLTSRPPQWDQPALNTLLPGPFHFPPLVNRVIETLSLLKLFVVLGFLDVVSLADRTRATLNESLSAFVTSIEHWFGRLRTAFVDIKSNRERLPPPTAGGGGGGGGGGSGGGGGGGGGGGDGQGRRRRRAGKATRDGSAQASGAGAAANHQGAAANKDQGTASATPTNGGATATVLGKRTSGDTSDQPAPKQPATRSYAKCNWVGTDGAACPRVPPDGARSNHPLCRLHRNNLDGMSPADRKAHVDRINALGTCKLTA